MKQILTCNKCGKLFISEVLTDLCENCTSLAIINDDPMEVAPKNIMKLVAQFEKITHPRLIANALHELDFVCNRAYMRGYISEEFYREVCEELELTPMFDGLITLFDDYYDYSDSAKSGFYYDMFEGGED